jgi:U6 snRNA-associated Sm-like protein LSm6
MENAPASEGKDPSLFLSEIIGAPVIVKLNSGVVYKGMDFSSNSHWLHY